MARISGLALVATPIGNARDITLRALDVLNYIDAIACEDTRVTAKLLAIHGISKPLLAYHEHNAERARPILIERLKSGETVALVSDAGTPLISDPGYKLVRACLENGIPVTPIPGASAVLTALVVSGLPTDRFLFAGFLPAKRAARRRVLGELRGIAASLVFMESAKRLAASLADMAETLGPRPCAVAREMTKLFEEVRRGSLDELAANYKESGPPKGEVTVVVSPPAAGEAADAADIDRMLVGELRRSTMRDAVAHVAAATGAPRRQVYARALALKRDPA
ncbi:MAG: 16S rRNA (cytidine(1402)-2'-O)-methyltransferase [Rhodospirillales bacterium]